MEWYENEVAAKERALHLACDRNPRLAKPVWFYGSSSIRLWRTLPDDFQGKPVVNAGFGGSTLVACTWFFDRLVAPFHPAHVVVYAGDNDLGDGISRTQFADRLDDFLTTLDHFLPDIPLTFLTIKPSPARWGLENLILACNALITERLSRRQQSRVIDIHQPMLGADGQPRQELYADDHLHLSSAGYALWTTLLSAHADHLFATKGLDA